MSDLELIALGFSCACKDVHGSVQVPASGLPLRMELCHCNICRRQTGLLAASYVALPKEHKGFKITGHTTGYKASEDLVRYFCSTCGSNVYVDEIKFDSMSLCSGVLSSNTVNVQLGSHIFVDDTKDGGMTAWLPAIPGWGGFSEQSQQIDCSRRFFNQPEDSAQSTTSELRSYCHCQSIQFKITRPNEKSSQLRGPFADLLAPYVSSDPDMIANEDNVKWWLRRQGSRYLAGTCACNSCRSNSGFDIQPWAFIPKVNLLDMNDEQLDVEKMSDLVQYDSSEGVHRHFCRKCGATVFWRCASRPDLVDVSAGLLDAAEGSRAESWLQWWTDRISFEEDAPNRAFINSLQSGLKKWGEQKSE